MRSLGWFGPGRRRRRCSLGSMKAERRKRRKRRRRRRSLCDLKRAR
jgi:hypothetical protein